MNTVALVVMVALIGQQTPDAQAPKTVTFNDPKLGLLFDHPPTWKIEKDKKGHAGSKSEKGLTVMSLPTTTSPTGATLEIFHAKFASTPDIWQTVQLRSNEQLHRKVERQWQQDILGVPLLLTRISYTEKGSPITTLTGLLYTRTHDKLLFRLVGPTSDFDNVQYGFTTAMQTLRTVDGVMPVQEDPDHPLPPATKSDPVPAARIPLVTATKPTKVILAPLTAKLVVSTKNLVFHYPLGWTLVNSQPSSVTLKSEDLSAPVTFTFFSSLDSDPASVALMNLTVQDLNKFNTVDERLDPPTTTNSSGCTISTVWRIGKDSKGPLYTLQGSGQQGDYYFIVNFKGTTADDSAEDSKTVLKLLKAVSLVLQP
jgi:hypothetical protein